MSESKANKLPKPAKPVGKKGAGAEASAGPAPGTDKPPRKRRSDRGKQRRKRLAPDYELIESGFSQLLTLPAMPASMAGDQWAADHFAERGPALAKRLRTEAERNDRLREICVSLLKSQSILMLGFEGFMYAALPLMHFGFIPGAEQFGVPVTRTRPSWGPPDPDEFEPEAEDDEYAAPRHEDAVGVAKPPPVEPL